MLPENFVYLSDIDHTILQDIRYASELNFVGTKIDGYLAPRAIMTKVAAEALRSIQKQVEKDGLSLVIYDAYRPQKAVMHFTRWAEGSTQKMKKEYYPHIDKSQSFELGYISRTSAHCKGSTVDLTLIDKSSHLKKHSKIIYSKRTLLKDKEILFLDDGTLDMGSQFDLFDEASWHANDFVSGKHLENRKYLRNIMMKNGFDDYRKEWWHYRFLDEPFPDTDFDFDIK